LLNEVEIVTETRSNQIDNNNHSSSGLNILDFLYGAGGDIGKELFKNGNYRQTNGNIGNFNDKPFKRLSKNAKAHYNFYKDLKSLNKAGIATTVILGSIEISNGAIQDYKNYTTTGYTNGNNTAVASGKVAGGVIGAWGGAKGGAVIGAAFGSVVPVIGTGAGAIVGGIIGAFICSDIGSSAGENAVEAVYK